MAFLQTEFPLDIVQHNLDSLYLPCIASEIAYRIAQLVNTLVGLAMHVAMVKGLKRKLWCIMSFRKNTFPQGVKRYHAATSILLNLICLLGDVNILDERDSPDSAIIMSAFALSKSTRMYKRLVKNGQVL
jgi:hypothetical protein